MTVNADLRAEYQQIDINWHRANGALFTLVTLMRDKTLSAYDRKCARRAYKLAEAHRDALRNRRDLLHQAIREQGGFE